MNVFRIQITLLAACFIFVTGKTQFAQQTTNASQAKPKSEQSQTPLPVNSLPKSQDQSLQSIPIVTPLETPPIPIVQAPQKTVPLPIIQAVRDRPSNRQTYRPNQNRYALSNYQNKTPTQRQDDKQSNQQDNNRNPQQSRNQERQRIIEQGRAAFNTACVQCHDANRSLKKRKSYSAWLTTVKRMAAMEDANVRSSDFVPIARYLESVGKPVQITDAQQGDAGDEKGDDSSDEDTAADVDLGLNNGLGFNLSSTISPLYRGSDFTNTVENPGIFVDAWISMDFDRGGAFTGKVTVCTSCHSRDQGFTVELVEATARLDLMKAFLGGCESKNCEPRLHMAVEAGRFIVPFGAIANNSHPGVSRTVTLPLMFNMGRRVFGNVGPPRQPVLPMPFSDEGINTEIQIDLPLKQSLKLDFYATNGLQDGPGGPFFVSRRYYDNNELPAYGGRVTIGGSYLKLGASAMTGDYNATGAPQRTYEIYGFDGTARYKDIVRYYFEYAIRDEDSRFGPGKDYVYGIVSELEFRLIKKVSLLGRYDTLEYRDNLGPDTTLKRFTWGFNMSLPGGSTLLINHEHWIFPDPQDDVDVIGARWVATY